MTTTFEIKPEDVLNLAAEKLADEVGNSITIKEMVTDVIAKRIDAAMKECVLGKIDGILSNVLEGMMTEAITPVDIWGDPVGEPTTIKASLNAKAKDFWSQLVDAEGKVPKEVNYYNRDRMKTRAEWMLGRVVAEEFSALVKQDAVNILGSFKEKLRTDTHAQIDRHLDDLIKVKSR